VVWVQKCDRVNVAWITQSALFSKSCSFSFCRSRPSDGYNQSLRDGKHRSYYYYYYYYTWMCTWAVNLVYNIQFISLNFTKCKPATIWTLNIFRPGILYNVVEEAEVWVWEQKKKSCTVSCNSCYFAPNQPERIKGLFMQSWSLLQTKWTVQGKLSH